MRVYVARTKRPATSWAKHSAKASTGQRRSGTRKTSFNAAKGVSGPAGKPRTLGPAPSYTPCLALREMGARCYRTIPNRQGQPPLRVCCYRIFLKVGRSRASRQNHLNSGSAIRMEKHSLLVWDTARHCHRQRDPVRLDNFSSVLPESGHHLMLRIRGAPRGQRSSRAR